MLNLNYFSQNHFIKIKKSLYYGKVYEKYIDI